LAERQGYTQGVGLSYQVDFNSFKELMQKVFNKQGKLEEEKEPSPGKQPTQVMGKDSLIRFSEKPVNHP